MISSWIVFSVIAVLVVLVTGLISFHFFLIYNKITTYEYLILKKKVHKIAPSEQHN